MNVAVKVTPSETRDSGKVRMGSLSPSFPAVRATPAQTADSGKVRMGSLSPSFPAVRATPAQTADSGKVRMGSLSPSFPAVRATPAQTADSGKVRMGSLSPSFPAVRTTPAQTADSGKVRMGITAARRSNAELRPYQGRRCPDTSSLASAAIAAGMLCCPSDPGRIEAVMDQPSPDVPLVKFYRFLPGARAPQRADRSAAGSMPTRAFRYCEAMRDRLRARLVRLSADEFQIDVGRRE